MTSVKNWTPDRLPALNGKTYLITGGNSGIGLEAAKMLSEAGADIIIACRNADKAATAAQQIRQTGEGDCEIVLLDLASMDSVEKAAADVRKRWSSLNGFINNAGIMQPPETRTVDGFELQFATNHLGHFLFTGMLFDLVDAASGRIVVVSSLAHLLGKMNFDDLMFEQNYNASLAYGQSKLANLMFALDLDRRLRAANSSVSCVACHPGYSATELQSTGPTGLLNTTYKFLNKVFAQSAYRGAIPTALAAAGDEAQSGDYFGPTAFGGGWGPVGNAYVAPKARNEEHAATLWSMSEELVRFDWPTI